MQVAPRAPFLPRRKCSSRVVPCLKKLRSAYGAASFARYPLCLRAEGKEFTRLAWRELYVDQLRCALCATAVLRVRNAGNSP